MKQEKKKYRNRRRQSCKPHCYMQRHTTHHYGSTKDNSPNKTVVVAMEKVAAMEVVVTLGACLVVTLGHQTCAQ